MNCKYKKAGNERLCEPIHGECLFVTSNYGEKCPIYLMLENRRNNSAESSQETSEA